MSRVLVTFSGKHGDILWAAQSARALALTGRTVDFAFMPHYRGVGPLLAMQPYIEKAFAIEEWWQQHDMYGAQPRIPPSVPQGYDEVHHLTYEAHPVEPLIWYGIRRLGLPMPDPILPFFEAPAEPEPDLIAYAFNDTYQQEKLRLLIQLKQAVPKIRFENVAALPFEQAARRIQAARFFFGCRSSNYVIAQGLHKRVLTIEPDGGRRSDVFGCPGSREHMPHPAFTDQFIDLTKQWVKTCD